MPPPDLTWWDLRLLSAYTSGISVLVLVARAFHKRSQPGDDTRAPAAAYLRSWSILRLLLVVGALGLSVYAAATQDVWSLVDVLGCASLAYAAVLLTTPARAHATVVLFAALAPLLYCDVWPLCTFTLRPAEDAQGAALWARIALLAGAGVLLPLLEPRAAPEDAPPEARASALSLASFAFVDALVWKAQRAPQVNAADLPRLRAADRTAALVERARGALAGRTLLRGLLRMFRGPLAAQAALMLLNSLASFLSPVGVNGLLRYLETDGAGAVVRPWVWVALVSGGPLLAGTLQHLARFVANRTFVRVGAVITERVFEHALHIRLVQSAPGLASASMGVASLDVEGVDPTLLDAPLLAEPESADGTSEAPANNLQGKINNLVTSDLANVMGGEEIVGSLVAVPMNALLAIALLYALLGWASLVGFAVMAVLFPVPARLGALMGGTQVKRMAAADARVQAITETLGVLRMIKLFALEKKVQEDLAQKRAVELRYIQRGKLMQLANNIVNHTTPLVHLIVTFFVYTVVMKRELTASVVFSAIIAFDLLRWQIFAAFQTIPALVEARVSLDRVEEFLHDTEVVDPPPLPMAQHAKCIGFGPSRFTWSPSSADSNPFQLEIREELVFKEGVLNLIIGPTASGKSSLLYALLGEMHYTKNNNNSWFHLPREHGVAYAAQEAWVISGTVKDNILFGSEFDGDRYGKVLHQCALEQDVSLWQAGDRTEVGEKGVTLSGGQKARISLARAVYSTAGIVLLDDILAALDIHTSKHVVEKCLQGDLLRGRTVILVTHNVALTMSIARFVVCLRDGRIHSQGAANEVLVDEVDVSHELEKQQAQIKSELVAGEAEHVSTPSVAGAEQGKLVVAEEKNEGRVSFKSFRLFLDLVAGPVPFLFWALYLIGAVGALAALTLEPWWLGVWANQYAGKTSSEVDVNYYLLIYTAIVGVSLITHALAVTVWTLGSIRASRAIHARLLSSIVSSTFRFLESTPTSRILARSTQDVQSFDGGIPDHINWFVDALIGVGLKFVFIVPFAPLFLPFGIVVLIVGIAIGSVYMKAQLAVKRELANAKAPVLHVFNGALSSLASVRAYGCQAMFRDQLYGQNDRYMTCDRTYNNLSRWIGSRMSFIGAMFTATLSIHLVYGKNRPNPSNVGFLLNTAAMVGEYVLWAVQVWNGLEVEGNSLERLEGYMNIPQEPKATDAGAPPAYWPASGELRIVNLCARYASDGPDVLKNLTFTIRSGERVGIVGRTGSGKSTLTMALLRAISTTGEVHYDGLDTSRTNLDALRSNISIIPQAPELIVGTLRQNLDPWGQHDDAMLNDALRSAGLNDLPVTNNNDKTRLTLDLNITAGGGNLSLGQRQIVSLARAMVRQSKILILDEATSAIDYDTDAAIQRSLRHELPKDVTVLIVAHRLQSVHDADKIMVLDTGRLVEFDSPKNLLGKEGGFFRALVDESGDKEMLHQILGTTPRV